MFLINFKNKNYYFGSIQQMRPFNFLVNSFQTSYFKTVNLKSS